MPATETMNIPRSTGVALTDRLAGHDTPPWLVASTERGEIMKDLRTNVAVRLLAAASSVTAIVLVVGAGVKF